MPEWVPYFLAAVVLVQAWLLLQRSFHHDEDRAEILRLRRELLAMKHDADAREDWRKDQQMLIDRQWKDANEIERLRVAAKDAERDRDQALKAYGAAMLLLHPEHANASPSPTSQQERADV